MSQNQTLVTVCGNLAADPDHRRTDAGLDITSFRIGSTPRYWNRDDKRFIDGETSWYNVTAWRYMAMHCADSLRRGDPVIVHGKLRVRPWSKADTGRSGTSVDLEAYAIGHDLSWGTSEFTRVKHIEKFEREGQEEADAMSDQLEEQWAENDGLPPVDANGVLLDEEPSAV